MLEFDNQVGSEDTALVEAVQRGAGSGASSTAACSPGPRC